jgi:hypothetical protein
MIDIIMFALLSTPFALAGFYVWACDRITVP